VGPLLLAVVAIAEYFAIGRVEPLTVPMLFYAGFVFGGIIGIVVHEAGHLLCAVAMAIPVALFSIGTGPLLFRLRVGETSLVLRQRFWNAGYVTAYPALFAYKYRTILFHMGGVLGQAVLLAFVIWSSERLPLPLYLGILFSGGAFAQVVGIVGSLIPRNLNIDGMTLNSDGWQIWQTLRGPRSGPTRADAYLAARLRSYGGGEVPKVSEAAPRLCYHLSCDRWSDEPLRREVDAALRRELGRGGLTREEELFVLDALGTDALLFRDPALLVHLDEWSLRALTLAPDIGTVRGTRGGALVELGRYAEAKVYLEPLTSPEQTPLDRVLSHAFLARAERGLGDTAAARRHVSEARRVSSATALSRTITTFVESIAADVGVDQQREELETARLPG
jgi:hypothetical protein